MDLNKARRTRDGVRLGDWDDAKWCEAHRNLIDGDNRCIQCEKDAEEKERLAKIAKSKKKKGKSNGGK